MRMRKNKPLTKKRIILNRLIFIGSIVILVIALSVSGIVLFQKLYFTPFWVNGQSMYPTLNANAKYSDGTLVGEVQNKSQDGEYDVDYGFMDTSEKKINKISRFEIIIFKASSSMVSYNIKRVIALPGETFYITTNETSSENGNLYVLNSQTEKYELIDQPISDDLVHYGLYPESYSVPTKLGDDEYFVMGDNRLGDNSYDSRASGPIKKELIIGVAIGLNGYATLGIKDGNITTISVKHYWPRFF